MTLQDCKEVISCQIQITTCRWIVRCSDSSCTHCLLHLGHVLSRLLSILSVAARFTPFCQQINFLLPIKPNPRSLALFVSATSRQANRASLIRSRNPSIRVYIVLEKHNNPFYPPHLLPQTTFSPGYTLLPAIFSKSFLVSCSNA